MANWIAIFIIGSLGVSAGIITAGFLAGGKNAELERRLLDIETRLQNRNFFIERAYAALVEISQLQKTANGTLERAVNIALDIVSDTRGFSDAQGFCGASVSLVPSLRE
jgi:hypothetical protein